MQAGQVQLDYFKCPAWPDLIAEAQKTLPVYIHFPLNVGNGQGYPQNEETQAPADLDWIAALLDQTGTPLVNTHFTPAAARYPAIPIDSRDPGHIRRVIDSTLRDLEPLIKRFGAERVTLENIINEYGWLTMAALPEVITQLVKASGCGFLFDLSHARLAARGLGMDEQEYILGLPLASIREIHVTGLQILTPQLLARVHAAGIQRWPSDELQGKWLDHFAMQEADWAAFSWMLGQLARANGGTWRKPWVVAYEYGGVGGFWELITERAIYEAQLPRMYQGVSNSGGG